MTISNNPWLINKSLWNITTVHLSPSQPDLTRISENPKYTHKSTDGQPIESGAWRLSQHCQTDQMSVWESGGNGKEGQRQTYHLFWSHGKWGISGGWRWAINKVMSVKGGGSLNYRLHWVNYSMTHGKYWCPISLWTTNYRSGPTFLFFFPRSMCMLLLKCVILNGSEHAVRLSTIYLQCTWLRGLVRIITSDMLIISQSHIWPFFRLSASAVESISLKEVLHCSCNIPKKKNKCECVHLITNNKIL